MSGAACTTADVCGFTIHALACSSLGRRSSSSCGCRGEGRRCDGVGVEHRRCWPPSPLQASAPPTHLCTLVCEVWVPAKLSALLDVAMRYLQEGKGGGGATAGGSVGGRAVALGRAHWPAGLGSWVSAALHNSRAPHLHFLRALTRPPRLPLLKAAAASAGCARAAGGECANPMQRDAEASSKLTGARDVAPPGGLGNCRFC